MSSLNYAIYVSPLFKGSRENKSLSTSSLKVVSSINTKYLSDVTVEKLREPFNVNTSKQENTLVINEHSSGETLFIPCRSFISPDVSFSRKVVSEMIFNMGIPFSLDRLQWKLLSTEIYTPVENRNDLVQKILDYVRGNILGYGPGIEASPYKEMTLHLGITKKIILPHHEFQTMVAAKRDEESLQQAIQAIAWMYRKERICGTPMPDLARNYFIEDVLREAAECRGQKSLNPFTQRMILESAEEAARSETIPAAKLRTEGFKEVVFEGQDITDTCAICLEKLPVGCSVVSLPCSHKFDKSCIVRWLEKNDVCPLCRVKLPTYQ